MLETLLAEIRKFNDERDWAKFHSPKNLATSVLIEAAELAEIFQWLTEEESRTLGHKAKIHAEEEIADVFIYLLNLADKLGIDPVEASHRKILQNGKKYPVNSSRGNRLKYTEFTDIK
ncbi:MAG: nucleotide pyrophosphohydrolase [Candidatus Fermentibacteria bacterium]|nr:nucleotide pyrophosphohydrolase [Candidatus Fermentibacteria bacterium]